MNSDLHFAKVLRAEIARLPFSIDVKVFLTIRSFDFGTGAAQLSLSAIASIVGVNRKRVSASTRRLEAAEIFTIVHGGQGNHTNRYLFARRKEDPASTTDAGISAPGGLSQGTIPATEKVAPSRGSQQTPAGGHKRSPPGGPLEKRDSREASPPKRGEGDSTLANGGNTGRAFAAHPQRRQH